MPDIPIASELTEILLRAHESKDFDYKAAGKWDEKDKKACCEIVKDILAMANTQGGFIAIGVSEQSSGFVFDGLSTSEGDSFDTSRLNRFLQNYSDPPINALLRKVTYDGKLFVLIEVPTFPDTPHICLKEFPGTLTAPTLYVRTDNNESAPVRSAADFQSVVERAVRNRGDALLSSFRSILTRGTAPPEPTAQEQFLHQRNQSVTRFEQVNTLKHEEPLLGYFEATFVPEQFDPGRFPLNTLRAAAERAEVTYTGWPFLYFDREQMKRTYVVQDGWETFIQDKDFGGHYLMDFWRLQQSGFFYYRTILRPSGTRSDQGDSPMADVKFLAIYIAEAIDCLTRLYDGLFEDTDTITLNLRLFDTNGRRLVNSEPGSMPLWAPYICRIPEITVERRFSLAEWRAAIIDHAVAMTNDVYQRFNWTNPNLSLARNAMERTFARRW
jgi:hypothetical protein